jgi:hypothetical protein
MPTLLDYPEFENWAQYTRAARYYMPRALGRADDAPWSRADLAALLDVESDHISAIELDDRRPLKEFQLHLRLLMAMARHGLDPRNIDLPQTAQP